VLTLSLRENTGGLTPRRSPGSGFGPWCGTPCQGRGRQPPSEDRLRESSSFAPAKDDNNFRARSCDVYPARSLYFTPGPSRRRGVENSPRRHEGRNTKEDRRQIDFAGCHVRGGFAHAGSSSRRDLPGLDGLSRFSTPRRSWRYLPVHSSARPSVSSRARSREESTRCTATPSSIDNAAVVAGAASARRCSRRHTLPATALVGGTCRSSLRCRLP
jgi:hypothetical protein